MLHPEDLGEAPVKLNTRSADGDTPLHDVLAMTVAFEFLFGHYVAGHSWDRLLHDYNLFAGRVWVVVLVWVTVAPYLFFRLRG